MNDLELDALAFRWRGALDTAANSLGQVERSRRVLHFSPAELRALASEVERERSLTDVDLERLAISPQCGFATSVIGNALTPDAQSAKLELLARVAGPRRAVERPVALAAAGV